MTDDALWEAEFRGFFWGEGCVQVHYYHTIRKAIRRADDNREVRFRPKLSISLRDDDKYILEDIQQHLGGHIYYQLRPGGDRKLPMIAWQVTAKENVRRVYQVLCRGILPAKKRQQLALFGEFLDVMHRTGQKYTDAEKAHVAVIIAELRRLKQYGELPEGQAISA